MSNSQPLTSRNWFGKASAGVILGFTLALACTSLLLELLAIGDSFFSGEGQVAMWLMAPIWSLVVSFCFLFGTGARAWVGLGLLNLVVWLLYVAVRLVA